MSWADPVRADNVVIGAGSAGAVVAARLAEAGEQVLLVEAGRDYPSIAAMPRDLLDGTRNSVVDHDWGYRYLPVPTEGERHFPRGRVVGGSSAVNTCIALRPLPSDLDEWVELGLKEWSWLRCLPALKRLERDLDFDDDYHGRTGPIPVRRHQPTELALWQRAFLDACADLGFARCDDLNAPGAQGYGPHPMNKVDGRRMSTALCYLTPETRARPELEIASECLVHRVLFRDARVVGVEVEQGGEVSTVHTERVILCAGAIGTPGILLRSGIGPKEELARLGVESVAEVAGVAAQLLDHPGVAIVLMPRTGLCSTQDPMIQTALRFTSQTARYEGDMQLQPGSWLPLPAGDYPLFTLMAQVGKPRDKGRICFASADPRTPPLIQSNFLVDPDDLEQGSEVMELAWLLATSHAMRDLARCIFPAERSLTTRRKIRAWLPSQCGSGYHPCGTAKMGADHDALAVADSRGRVRQVRGCWIADASLMPSLPAANTNVTTIMIAERVAEWVLES